MVAIAYTDITTPAPRAATQATQRPVRRVAQNSHQDPVVDMTTRLLSAPLHQMYAFLWRVGVLVVNE